MRVADYRYYGRICLGFGIILLVVGVVLPTFMISWFTNYGIVMAVVGVILIVVSQVLYGEYRFKNREQPPPPSSLPQSPKTQAIPHKRL